MLVDGTNSRKIGTGRTTNKKTVPCCVTNWSFRAIKSGLLKCDLFLFILSGFEVGFEILKTFMVDRKCLFFSVTKAQTVMILSWFSSSTYFNKISHFYFRIDSTRSSKPPHECKLSSSSASIYWHTHIPHPIEKRILRCLVTVFILPRIPNWSGTMDHLSSRLNVGGTAKCRVDKFQAPFGFSDFSNSKKEINFPKLINHVPDVDS